MKGRDILVAFDGSESAFKAVEYVGSQFSGLSDVKITLLYVIPGVPAQFWDDGHMLSAAEKENRQRVIDVWLSNQETVLAPPFEKARRMLTDKGMGTDQIENKVRSNMASVAEGILEEAKEGEYKTLVLGRRKAVPILTGSLARTILHKGAGLTICIVE
ncbi:MAG TPA: universal stress protein [Syntrophorhabdaceae bacterium]|nr:universal stress protein [Syntrophorhabdaceae bacterium]